LSSWKRIVMEENISKPDLYVCEISSPISDQVISISSAGEQPSLSVVHLSSSRASWNEKYTREKLQHLFKYNKTQYVVLMFSIIWTIRNHWFVGVHLVFLQAQFERYSSKSKGFVSCNSCFTTYSYVSNSTILKMHNCKSSYRKTNSTSSSSQTSSSS
jgi:hypothetical protein